MLQGAVVKPTVRSTTSSTVPRPGSQSDLTFPLFNSAGRQLGGGGGRARLPYIHRVYKQLTGFPVPRLFVCLFVIVGAGGGIRTTLWLTAAYKHGKSLLYLLYIR